MMMHTTPSTGRRFLDALQCISSPSATLEDDEGTKRLQERQKLLALLQPMAGLIGIAPDGLDGGGDAVAKLLTRWGGAYAEKSNKCPPDALKLLGKQVAGLLDKHEEASALALRDATPLPWLCRVLLGEDLQPANLDTADAFGELVARLDAAALWLTTQDPELLAVTWVARPLLAFRQLDDQGAAFELPLLDAVLRSNIDLDAVDSKLKVPLEAAQNWSRSTDGSGVSLDKIQLPPCTTWPGSRAQRSSALMQALTEARFGWVLRFLGEEVFGTRTDLLLLCKVLIWMLDQIARDGRIAFVRPVPGDETQRDWFKQSAASGHQLQVTLEVPESARPIEKRGLPLSVCTDHQGDVLFPMVIAPANGSAVQSSVETDGHSPLKGRLATARLPHIMVAGQWPFWILRLGDARTANGLVHNVPIDRRTTLPTDQAKLLAIKWDEQVEDSNKEKLGARARRLLQKQASPSTFESVLDRITAGADPELARVPDGMTDDEHRAWAALRWPRVMTKIHGIDSPVALAPLFATSVGDGQTTNRPELVSAQLYASQLAKSLDGESFRDAAQTSASLANVGTEPEAMAAWRMLMKAQPFAFKNELAAAEPKTEAPPALPMRAEHWLRLQAELADTRLAVPGDASAVPSTAQTLAKAVLAADVVGRIGHVLHQERLRLLGSLVHAFSDPKSLGMASVLSRFEAAWVALAGISDDGLPPAGMATDGAAVRAALKAAGLYGAAAIARTSTADLLRLAEVKLASSFPRWAIVQEIERIRSSFELATRAKVLVSEKLQAATVQALRAQDDASGEEPDSQKASLIPKTPEKTCGPVGNPIKLPTLRTLFGSMDVCACDEHESVYGAPAYLVDVLEFLRYRLNRDSERAANHAMRSVEAPGASGSRSAQGGVCGCYPRPANALEVLLERRPDLEHLDLNLQNTSTPLPYIDLVNEVLEAALSGDPETLGDMISVAWSKDIEQDKQVPSELLQKLRQEGVDVTSAARFRAVDLPDDEVAQAPCREVFILRDVHAVVRFQRERPASRWHISRNRNTTYGEAALAAEPEYVNESVYDELERVTNGLSLPFSLHEARIDEYLKLVDGKLLDVQQEWVNDSIVNPDARVRRAGLALGLQWAQARVIANSVDGFDDEALWQRIAPDGSTKQHATVDELLRGLELSAEELQSWSRTATLKAAGFDLDWSGTEDCNTTKVLLKWPAGSKPYLLSRCVRLQRVLEWPVEDVDRAINAPRIGGGKLDTACLERIAKLRSVAERLALPLESACGMFGALPLFGYEKLEDSLYWRVLLDPRRTGDGVFSAVYEKFLPKAIGNHRLSELRAPLAMRLGIAVAELDALASELFASKAFVLDATVTSRDPDPRLQPDVLSLLWAHCKVRGALDLSWLDYLAALRLFSARGKRRSPFGSPASLVAFVDWLEMVGRNSTLSLAQLCLLVSGRVPAIRGHEAPAHVEPKDTALRTAQIDVAKELAVAEHPEKSMLARQLWAERREAPDVRAWAAKWWTAIGGAVEGDFATACWAPIAASADEIDSARDRLLGAAPDVDSLGASLPTGRELKEGGAVFEAFRRLLSYRTLPGSPPAGGADAFTKDWTDLKSALEPVLAWAGFGRQSEAWLRAIEATLRDRARQAGVPEMAPPLGKPEDGSDSGSHAAESVKSTSGMQGVASATDQALTFLLGAPCVAKNEVSDLRRRVLAALAGIAPVSPRVLEQLLRRLNVDDIDADDWLWRQDGQGLLRAWQSADQHEVLDGSQLPFPRHPEVRKLWLLLKRIARISVLLQGLGATERTQIWLLGTHASKLGILEVRAVPGWTWHEPPAEASDAGSTDKAVVQLSAEVAMPKVAAELAHLILFLDLSKQLPEVEDGLNPERALTFAGLLSTAIEAKKLLETEAPSPKALRLSELAFRATLAMWDRMAGYPNGAALDVLAEGKDDLEHPFKAGELRVGLDRLLHLENYPLIASRAAWSRTTGIGQAHLLRLIWLPAEASKKGALADDIRAEIKKRFVERDWLNAIKAGTDRLRERKRDALLDRILGEPIPRYFDENGASLRFKDKNDVLNHYLIDPQMSACMPTSRIVQAHAAVQMFVQRCLMGLESKVSIADDQLIGWAPWEWMKQFRVWQAARKIFLYPENWIDHELRDDRSSFFKDLQDDLSQGKLNEKAVENAVISYLQKLNTVAKLETCSIYYEFTSQARIVHIVGRTRSEPRSYFYRRWIDEAEWTPWEPIDLEINTDQVCIFVRNGRTYVCWLNASAKEERPSTVEQAKQDAPVKPAKAYWELKLAISEYDNSRWSPKRVGSGALALGRAEEVQKLDSAAVKKLSLIFQDLAHPVVALYSRDGSGGDTYVGAFNLSTCSIDIAAVPVSDETAKTEILPIVQRTRFAAMRFIESDEGAFVVKEGNGPEGSVELRLSTRGTFAVTIPQQSSSLDFLLGAIKVVVADGTGTRPGITAGAWLPLCYEAGAEYRPFVERAADGSSPVADVMRLVGMTRAAATRPKVRESIRELSGALQRVVSQSRDPAILQPKLTALWLAVRDEADLALVTNEASWQERLEKALGDGSGYTHYPGRLAHPASCDLLQTVTGAGLKYLYFRDIQQEGLDSDVPVNDDAGEERYRIAYRPHDGYASYNWEVFVHIPLLIAKRLVAEGDHDGARRWFQSIFNVTGTAEKAGASSPSANPRVGKYWIPRHFSEMSDALYEAQHISNLIRPAYWQQAPDRVMLQQLYRSVKGWRVDPFNPHLVARNRWVAFQKAVAYQYIELLLDHGDDRFRSDTRESVTEATALYVQAQALLGPRPVTLRSEAVREDKNFEQIRKSVEAADDALANDAHQSFQIGSWAIGGERVSNTAGLQGRNDGAGAFSIYNDYFCIPPNSDLSALWDRVEDRLEKIRTCRNIDGVERTLALFAPPIDPAALVRARGAGGSVDAALAGLSQPLPHYRFAWVLQRAKEFTQHTKALGDQLLQIIEKRDAEALGLLRARHEVSLLKEMTNTRKGQIEEAQAQIDALDALKKTVEDREKWYRSRPAVSSLEQTSLDLAGAGTLLTGLAASASALASGAILIPRVAIGYDVGGLFYLEYGGQEISGASSNFSAFLSALGSVAQGTSSIIATKAMHERRKEEWKFQADQALAESTHIDKQIVAAQKRKRLAELEARTLDVQVGNAEELDQFLRDKFSNRQLYDWMLKRMSTVYSKMFQLALEHARMAERCLDAELPPRESARAPVVQSSYWDVGPRGLLASEPLMGDLLRLEAEWTKRNGRERELTKTVSLARIAPLELLRLRVSGKCEFSLTRQLYDRDFPQHARRRIKGVTFTLNCVSSPLTNISCQLTLLSSEIRLGKGQKPIVDPVPVQAVCSSSARDDAGLFEFNLRDDRYLPFEGAGAESRWALSIPGAHQFDWLTISDAVLNVRYTAQQVGADKGTVAEPYVEPFMISLRDEFTAEFMGLFGQPLAKPVEAMIRLSKTVAHGDDSKGTLVLCAICETEDAPSLEVNGSPLSSAKPIADVGKRTRSSLYEWTLDNSAWTMLTKDGLKIASKPSKALVRDLVLVRT